MHGISFAAAPLRGLISPHAPPLSGERRRKEGKGREGRGGRGKKEGRGAAVALKSQGPEGP